MDETGDSAAVEFSDEFVIDDVDGVFDDPRGAWMDGHKVFDGVSGDNSVHTSTRWNTGFFDCEKGVDESLWFCFGHTLCFIV